MKKGLVMFALAASSLLAGCGNKENKENVITLDNQKQNSDQTVKVSPCIIEVPCNEPELKHLDNKFAYGIMETKKYYDFCDSTVTILARGNGSSGPIYNNRSITDLHGTEKQEMEAAYTKYKTALGLK